MRNVCSSLVFVLAIGALGFAREPRQRGQVVEIIVPGAALEHNHVSDPPERSASVYLPPGYDKGAQPYPVVYLLHGYTGSDRGWMNPAYVGLPEMMDGLIERHTIAPMIVVMPNAFNRFGGSFYTNSALAGDWEDYIARDLVGYIDAHYRTIAKASRRGIAGHSMGGYGALRIGMDHPEIFSAAYGMSACCMYWSGTEDREDVVKAQRAKNLQEIVAAGIGPQAELALAAAFSPNLQNPPFGVDWPFDAKGEPVPEVISRWKANLLDAVASRYADGSPRLHALGFEVGRQDENKDIVIGAKKLDRQMTKLGVEHNYAEYDGSHSSRIGERMEKVVLPFLSKNLSR
jgi:S-formylglutathione hydrolase